MAEESLGADKEAGGSAATIVLKVQLSGHTAGHHRESFWSAISDRAKSALPGPPADTFEGRIRSNFAGQLEGRFRRYLASIQKQTAGAQDAGAQQAALSSLRIRVVNIAYGSIEIKTIIDNLDLIIEAFALTLDVVTTTLTAISPDALNAALDTPDVPWDVTLPVVDIPGLPAQPRAAAMPGQTPNQRAVARLWALLSSPTFLWKLFNALWALPILVSLAVLILVINDLMAVSAARDRDRSRMITDETTRAAALLERFEKQHEALLIRHDTAMKEATEAARVILHRERDLVKVRSDDLDRQHVQLIQRYETLIRDQSDTVRTLLQRPDPCCKPPSAAGKTSKPRCTGRRSGT